MTKRAVKKHYKKANPNLKGGIQRRNYYYEELEKLKEKIRKEQEEMDDNNK